MANLILTEKERRSFEARIWRGPEIACAIWVGHLKLDGYGRFKVNGRMEYVHRIAFVDGGGVLTEDEPDVLHSCDIRACVEFAHLSAGDDSRNALERTIRGRGHRSRCGLPRGVRLERSGRFSAAPYLGKDERGREIRPFLGSYVTVEEAARVAMVASDAYYRGRR